MLARAYVVTFAVVTALTGLLIGGGDTSDLTIAVLGFVLSTLLFVGVVGVLPWLVDHKFSWKY